MKLSNFQINMAITDFPIVNFLTPAYHKVFTSYVLLEIVVLFSG